MSDQVFEYGWSTEEETDAHSFIAPVLLRDMQLLCDGAEPGKIRVFDLGCGNGAIAGRLLKMGFQVSGCDASVMGIEQAKKNCAGDFQVASIYDDLVEKFGSGYDIVISSEVVEHLYNPRALPENACRLLKPGGHLILTTPYHGYLKNLVMALSGKLDKHFTVLWDGGHIKFWSYKTISDLLAEAGFEVKKFSGAGRLPYIWKSMVITAQKRAS